MKRQTKAVHALRRPQAKLAVLAQVVLLIGNANALELDTGNPDVKVHFDNTVKYSAGFRLKDADPLLSGSTQLGTNTNDGNNNFSKGLISSRVDLFSELDIATTNFGARLSGAAWNDGVYTRGNSNSSATSNHVGPANEFPDETRRLMGNGGELLDAFVWGRFDMAEKATSFRLGRHSLLWGESLFFGSNGIAGGQQPVDLVKLLSVPNSTFKEAIRPTGKLSGQVQLSDVVSVGGYVGYEWEKSRFTPSGAYLSSVDHMGPGGEQILTPTGVFKNAGDINATNSGQGGVQARFHVESVDTDFGLYAIRYHANMPSNNYSTLMGIPNVNLTPSSFQWAYHEGVRAFGASFAKTIGAWSLAGEASVRNNAPLASTPQSILPTIGVNVGLDNNSNPGYAVGETAHVQFNWLASLGPSFISNEASFLGEIAWNETTKVTQNRAMLNPNADTSASAIRMVYTPTYRQILPGLDLSPSIGVGYAWGRSSAVGPGFGVNQGGDVNLGITGVYLGRWTIAANYVHYLGTAANSADANNNAKFGQNLADRDYLTLSLRTTF